MIFLIIYQPIVGLSMITHNIIPDTTKVLLYPVVTTGLLDDEYNRFFNCYRHFRSYKIA
jgi:hypothetical protein